MTTQRRTTRQARRWITAAGAIGTVAATLALPSPAANAVAQAHPRSAIAAAEICLGNVELAVGCFRPYGDHVEVWDTRTDGLRVELVWGTDYGRSGTCAVRSGTDYRHCNYNMAENHEIQLILDVIDVQTGRSVWGESTVAIT